MTVALEDVLAKAGLRANAAEFLELVEQAASKLSPRNAVPTHYFSADQREALADVGLDLSPQRADERDSRVRSVVEQAVLAESALTVREAAGRLGVDDSRVRHRLKEHRLSGWKDQGGWRLPAWQFTTTGVLPGLDTVLRAVPDDQPTLVVAAFMTTPQPDLVVGGEDSTDATPRQWLLAGGEPRRVAELATTLGTPI